MLFIVGLITTITEWKEIHGTSPVKKDPVYLLFPVLYLTYIPISIAALFKKIGWDPIPHNISKSIEDFERS